MSVPIGDDYANSPFDVRQRFTINGNYQLPFGRGQEVRQSRRGPLDYLDRRLVQQSGVPGSDQRSTNDYRNEQHYQSEWLQQLRQFELVIRRREGGSAPPSNPRHHLPGKCSHRSKLV